MECRICPGNKLAWGWDRTSLRDQLEGTMVTEFRVDRYLGGSSP